MTNSVRHSEYIEEKGVHRHNRNDCRGQQYSRLLTPRKCHTLHQQGIQYYVFDHTNLAFINVSPWLCPRAATIRAIIRDLWKKTDHDLDIYPLYDFYNGVCCGI